MNARNLATVAALMVLGACATLSGLGIQAPRFSVADDRNAEIRLLGPSLDRPVGGAALRLYARIENPNPVGVTLSRLTGRLQLEGVDAADADFPLGLPLEAGEAAVVPLDISVSFTNLPRLADLLGRAVVGGEVAYNLRGTATVDAGVLGQPSFGPMNLLAGTVELRR